MFSRPDSKLDTFVFACEKIKLLGAVEDLEAGREDTIRVKSGRASDMIFDFFISLLPIFIIRIVGILWMGVAWRSPRGCRFLCST